jgi:hypothetical protein
MVFIDVDFSWRAFIHFFKVKRLLLIKIVYFISVFYGFLEDLSLPARSTTPILNLEV